MSSNGFLKPFRLPMPHGICHLSIIPLRSLADDTSEMRTQLLYGEHFTILEKRKSWSRIRAAFDKCEGWVCNEQYLPLTAEAGQALEEEPPAVYAADLVSFSSTPQHQLIPILLGSSVGRATLLGHFFEGAATNGTTDKKTLVDTALRYLNAPYLRGGKSPFGIDCSGLSQMVYRMQGVTLLRNAAAQAMQGEALSFIEESEAGDLAFFDNKEGVIDHVGIIMDNNYIIHSYGKVRIDRLDHTGIFNTELGLYTHQLRVIKKII